MRLCMPLNLSLVLRFLFSVYLKGDPTLYAAPARPCWESNASVYLQRYLRTLPQLDLAIQEVGRGCQLNCGSLAKVSVIILETAK